MHLHPVLRPGVLTAALLIIPVVGAPAAFAASPHSTRPALTVPSGSNDPTEQKTLQCTGTTGESIADCMDFAVEAEAAGWTCEPVDDGVACTEPPNQSGG